jgi:hypothetical protein
VQCTRLGDLGDLHGSKQLGELAHADGDFVFFVGHDAGMGWKSLLALMMFWEKKRLPRVVLKMERSIAKQF